MLYEAYVNLVFFWEGLKFLCLWGKKPFSGLFAKAYSSYNLQVRRVDFGQCIIYIVSNKNTNHYSIFVYLFLYIKKKLNVIKYSFYQVRFNILKI